MTFLYYFVSDLLLPIPHPEPAQPPLDPDQDFVRNFWSPPTNLYPFFLFPPAHGTFRTHRTESNIGTITGIGMGTATATKSTLAYGPHSSVEETLVTSLQFPELVVPFVTIIPGESAFSTVSLLFPFGCLSPLLA